MKFPAILTCLLAVLLASVPVRNAKADEVSFDVFYNNLADDGDWYNTPEYGYVWQPSVSVKNEKWRPYTDGYWAQTDSGWTWVSYENFGWATYHYGRWTRLKDIGWAWVPGYDWGPGWVSWRTNDDYVGWAPLPPKREQGVVEGGTAIVDRGPAVTVDYNDVEGNDYGANVDVQYDIGPQNYCFVETRHFAAPVLAEVILPPQRNFVVIERTVNVTNIYYDRGPGRPVYYNRGPDYNFLSAHCERPIQQLRIERREDITFLNNGIHGGANANQVRNGVFTVAAPPIMRGPVNFAQVKPVRIKQTITRTEVVHGWSNGGADPAAVQRLREQFKQQAQQAPPPRREMANQPPRPNEPARAREPGNVPPIEGGNKPLANQPNGAPRQPVPAVENPAQREAVERAREEKEKNRGNSQPMPAPQPPLAPRPDVRPTAPAAAGNPPANAQPLTPEERQARRAARQQAHEGQTTPDAQPVAEKQGPKPGDAAAPGSGQPLTPEERQARRAQRQQARDGQPPANAQPVEKQGPKPADATPDPDRDARRARREQQQAPQPEQAAKPAPQPPADPDRAGRRAQNPPEPAAAPYAPQPETQPAAPNPEREARRAQRQQEQTARQRAPQAEPTHPHSGDAPQPTATVKGDPDKKKPNNQ